MTRIILKLIFALGFVALTFIPAFRFIASRSHTLAFHRFPHTFAHTNTPLHFGSEPVEIGVRVTGMAGKREVDALLHIQPLESMPREPYPLTLHPSRIRDTVLFTGVIPAQPAGTVIKYWIELADTSNHRLGGFGLPEDGPLHITFAAPAPYGLQLVFDLFLRLAVFLAALIAANAFFPGTDGIGLREKEHRQILLTMIFLAVFVLPLSLLISSYTFGRIWTGWSPAVFWTQKGCLLAVVYWLFIAVKSRRLIGGKQTGVRFSRRRMPPIYSLVGLLILAAIAVAAPY